MRCCWTSATQATGGVIRLGGVRGHFVYVFNIHWFNKATQDDLATHPTLTTIFKRYSDFLALSEHLLTAYPSFLQFRLPPKSLKSSNQQLGGEEAVDRAASLTLFFNLILLNNELQESSLVADFIKKVPDTPVMTHGLLSTIQTEAKAAAAVLAALWNNNPAKTKPIVVNHLGVQQLTARLEQAGRDEERLRVWVGYTINMAIAFEKKLSFLQLNQDLLNQLDLKNSFGADFGMTQLQAERTHTIGGFGVSYLRVISRLLRVP